MGIAFAGTALLLGVAGAPHCAAMCGAACAGITASGRPRARASFQLGRLAGYALAGAGAAGAATSLAWFSAQAAALRPLWTLFHLGVLAWALALLVLARQPAFVARAASRAWRRIGPLAARSGGAFTAGLLWIFMPCGLLWSALLVASLSGGPLQGAASMALFALGGAGGLLAGPALFAALRRLPARFGRDAATRAAGLLLALASGWALWMDVSERIAQFCA